VEALRASFAFLIHRHPSLRSVVRSQGGEPFQEIVDGQKHIFNVIPAEDWPEHELQAQLAAGARQAFDLHAGPLLRVQVYLRSCHEAVLLFVAHHIALDLWSLAQIAEELSGAYAAIKAGKTPELPPLPNSYADFVAWQSSMLADQGRE